ncbi:MAG: DUF2782 domain-containing protein [Pseudomonadota bacterium]
MRICLGFVLTLLVSPVLAQEEAAEVPEEEEVLAPTVTIVEDGKNVIEEYRLNGQLYMIKVTPRKGRPYYLVDADGDGLLDRRRNDLDPDVMIPSWVLLKW